MSDMASSTSSKTLSSVDYTDAQLNSSSFNLNIAQKMPSVQHASVALNAVMGVQVPGANMTCGVPWAMPKPTDSGINVVFFDDFARNLRPSDYHRDGTTAPPAAGDDRMDISEPEQFANLQAAGLRSPLMGHREVSNDNEELRDEYSMSQASFDTQISHIGLAFPQEVSTSATGVPQSTPPNETQPRVVVDLCSPTPAPVAGRTRPAALNLASATYGAYTSAGDAPVIDLYQALASSPIEQEKEATTADKYTSGSTSSSSLPSPVPDRMALHTPHYWSEDLVKSLSIWVQHPETLQIQVNVQKIRFCRETTIGGVDTSSGLLTPPLPATGLYDAITRHHTCVNVMRILLPECARAPYDLPLFRDWIILQSNTDASPFATIKDMGPRPVSETAGESTFWLCAIPIAAIGNMRVGNMLGAGGQVVGTNLAISTKDMLPLMFGRNVTPWFLEHWLKACASGAGSLHITSQAQLPLHPLEFVGY